MKEDKNKGFWNGFWNGFYNKGLSWWVIVICIINIWFIISDGNIGFIIGALIGVNMFSHINYRLAERINGNKDIAYLLGFVLSLFGFIIYGIYYLYKRKKKRLS